ncbi:MAG: META domain-containing protein [Bacteroidaceae bacterium]
MIKTISRSMMMLGVCMTVGCASQQKTAQALAGKWNIESANGQGTAEGEKQAFITFGRNGEVNGCSSVNSFFGSYTLDGSKIQMSNLGMTRMMGPHMEIETAVTQALGQTYSVKVKGSKAQLLDKDGKPVMHLVKAK